MLLGLPRAAFGESSADIRYSRLTVQATFRVEVTYPDHPEAPRSGFYRRLIQYELRAIVAYDGRKISFPGKNAIVGGRIVVTDARKKPESFVPPPEQRRWVPVCRGWEGGAEDRALFTGTKALPTFKSAPTASVAVTQGRLNVGPGAPIKWQIPGCGEGNIADHGRQFLGPGIDVAAPARARFAGRRPFSIFCQDSYSHGFEAPNTGHEFSGLAYFRIAFAPFPRDQLGPNKKRLRSAMGAQDGRFLGQDPSAEAKECL
jgi:hypothetical protein